MYLRLVYPQVPTCRDCKAHVYDPKTWEAAKIPGGGKVKRPPGVPPPCHACPKLTPEDRRREDAGPHLACEMTERMQQAYLYFRLCKADPQGLLPVDGLVVEHNALFQMAEEDARADSLPLMYVPVRGG